MEDGSLDTPDLVLKELALQLLLLCQSSRLLDDNVSVSLILVDVILGLQDPEIMIDHGSQSVIVIRSFLINRLTCHEEAPQTAWDPCRYRVW